MLRQVYVVLIISWLFSSCDTRLESLIKYNDQPYILVGGESVNFVSDTMKARQGEYYDLRIEFFDRNNNISNIEYQVFSEAFGDLLSNGRLADGSYELGDLIEYAPLNIGLHQFSVTVKDKFQEFASVDYELLVTENLTPVLVVQVIEDSRFTRTVDASDSYDPDENLGGGISQYEFVLSGDTTLTTESRMTYDFDRTGPFRVLIRVQDNDEVWSPVEIVQLVIE